MGGAGLIGEAGRGSTARERLRSLAGFLKTIEPDRLTFSRWYGSGKGCAVGLAAMLHAGMRAQGLSLANEECLRRCRPVYDGKSDWEAVCAFFGISHAEATTLFTSKGYGNDAQPHPHRIAARVLAFLSGAAPAVAAERDSVDSLAA